MSSLVSKALQSLTYKIPGMVPVWSKYSSGSAVDDSGGFRYLQNHPHFRNHLSELGTRSWRTWHQPATLNAGTTFQKPQCTSRHCPDGTLRPSREYGVFWQRKPEYPKTGSHHRGWVCCPKIRTQDSFASVSWSSFITWGSFWMRCVCAESCDETEATSPIMVFMASWCSLLAWSRFNF